MFMSEKARVTLAIQSAKEDPSFSLLTDKTAKKVYHIRIKTAYSRMLRFGTQASRSGATSKVDTQILSST